jgi:DNA-binding GntR family transcriptional regulator
VTTPRPRFALGDGRSSLRESVADLVRAALVAGDMRPGEVYSVPALAAELGVSGTPVREALLDLAKDGLLEPVRNKGFRVTTLSDEDLDAIYRVRELLEVPSLVDVHATATPADLTRLRAVCRRIEQAAAAGDLSGYLAADRDFHLGMLGLTGNSRLVEIVSSLRSQTRLFGLPPLVAKKALGASAREHRTLLSLLAQDDLPAAQELMSRHLRHTRGSWAGREEGS